MVVIFYGLGENFIDFLSLQPDFYEIDNIIITDKDSNKWGKTLGGYVVLSPDEAFKNDFDRVVIFPDSYDLIKQELIQKFEIPSYKIFFKEELIVASKKNNTGTIEYTGPDNRLFFLTDTNPNIITNNKLEDFAFNASHNIISKWWHYFEIYHTHFNKFIGKKIKILEIGVFNGGSLQMWKNYFGDDAIVVGIDINPQCKEYEGENIHVCIGSQDDCDFLQNVSEKYGPFDIIVDDGSHMVNHQIITFEKLFCSLNEGGVYLVEDLHTSYWKRFGGSYKNEESFIEYSKNFIDYLNKQHIKENVDFPLYSDYIKSCHFYDSILVIDKKYKGKSVSNQFRGK